MNQAVYTRRFVVGNAAKMSSHWCSPPSGIIGSQGYIATSDYMQNINDRATGFTNLMNLDPGKFAYLTEAYVAAPDIDWKGFMGCTGAYAFNIF